ncbi:outer membrane protein assembly factor BamB family protein [Pyxidicoccus xibeiensis]|uniref:outer membrane protein assembly factor BamB family protein n=1 Tax=Pyxidicoccus xibeiensis TaxID=2906759 RepID=UPI0020A73F7E|nr:PQQ-binding-like beta-propeller repeat protein [Pyxidicoccus xibeiensis]MCP3142185.1 PQQ-like beta-propeller repeat protein [Pyxidicoccus xibeiensis]
MSLCNTRLAVLCAVLLPALALAQTNNRSFTVTQVLEPGETRARVTMDEVSELTVEVRNMTRTTSGNYQPLNQVEFTLPNGYVPLETSAPTGWSVAYNMGLRQFVFHLGVDCMGSGPFGLGFNVPVRFTLRMIPAANTNGVDITTDNFATGTGGTIARNQCSGGTFAATLGTPSSWVRHSLATHVSVMPRVLGVGGDIEARIVMENRTASGTVRADITAEGPTTGSGGVAFTVVGVEPTDFQADIERRSAGVLAARVRTTSGGTLEAQVRGTNAAATITSRVAETKMVNVGVLPAALDVDSTQAFTGETVQVRMTVTNPSTTDTFLNVAPRTPGFEGTAELTLQSGPSPASVPRLGPGASAHFVWRYQVSGVARADYRFTGQVDATRGGSAVTSSLVRSERGQVVLQRVRISAEAMAANSTNRTVVYTVQNRGPRPIIQVQLLRPTANYFAQPTNPVAPAGWTQFINDVNGISWFADPGIPQGGEQSFSVRYTNFGTGTSLTAPTSFRHRMHLLDDYELPPIRVEAPVTLLMGTAPEVARLTAVARDASVTLTWDNPAQHDGVLILRAVGAAPNLAPTPGLRYAAGATLGNATVVYADTFSSATSFTDTTVTNGTTYYYRVHNADEVRRYSAGNQPTSATLLATPRARVGSAPLWCYSVGLSALQQPITELGVGIYSSFNDSVVANLTQVSNPSQDGAERWRPLPLSGLIGSRFPVVPLRGLPGQYILVGDQAGVAYAINAATGAVLWRWDNGGTPIGTIQSFPVTQLHDFANAAYQAAHPGRDLVFFATRLANPALNQVVALNAATGAVVWRYQPGNLGMVSGGMLVDYPTNRLFIGSMTHAGSTDSLRIVNTLNGVEVARRPVGDIELSLVKNAVSNQVYATNSAGTVHAIDVATTQPAWSMAIATRPAPSTPAFTSFVRPQGAGFVASIAAGRVEFYDVTGAAGTQPTLRWSTPIANPSGVFSLNRDGVARIYVGSSDGRVHQLELTSGADSRQVSIGGAQRIGTPTIDHTVSRLHVGSEDGRICAFPVPFP